jgi:hypothetical protein
MKHETQAQRLAEMVQNRIHSPAYELALPLVEVHRNQLKKLSVDDVLLTGFDRLEFVLLEGNSVCAKTVFGYTGKIPRMEIVQLSNDSIAQSDKKKYKTVMFSFGTVKSKVLKLKHTIDIAHIDLEQVSLLAEGKMIAQGMLVNVDEEIAIQIKKVIK